MEEKEFAARIWEARQTLFRVCRAQLASPHDREDAVQETLERAWRKRKQLRSDAYLLTWLIRILLNVCHDMQRSGKRIVPVEQIELSGEERNQDGALRDALGALEERYRLPVMLHYIEGYPVRQVAQMLRLPEGTVKTRMKRGRQKLEAILNEEVFEA